MALIRKSSNKYSIKTEYYGTTMQKESAERRLMIRILDRLPSVQNGRSEKESGLTKYHPIKDRKDAFMGNGCW